MTLLALGTRSFSVEGCPLHCRMVSNILYLHPLDAEGSPPTPRGDGEKRSQALPNDLGRQARVQCPQLRTHPFIQALLCFKIVHFQNPFFTFGQNRFSQSPSFLFAPDVCISLFNLTSLLLSLSPHPPSFFQQIFLCLLQSKNCATSGDKTVPRIQTRILSIQEKVLKILTLIISY